MHRRIVCVHSLQLSPHVPFPLFHSHVVIFHVLCSTIEDARLKFIRRRNDEFAYRCSAQCRAYLKLPPSIKFKPFGGMLTAPY